MNKKILASSLLLALSTAAVASNSAQAATGEYQAIPYGLAMTQVDQLSDVDAGNIKVCIIDTGVDINHEDLPSGSNISGEVSNTLTASVDLGQWSTDSYGHG